MKQVAFRFSTRLGSHAGHHVLLTTVATFDLDKVDAAYGATAAKVSRMRKRPPNNSQVSTNGRIHPDQRGCRV